MWCLERENSVLKVKIRSQTMAYIFREVGSAACSYIPWVTPLCLATCHKPQGSKCNSSYEVIRAEQEFMLWPI